MTLRDRLLRSIRNAGADLFLRKDVDHLGEPGQVSRALAQLAREGVIEHVGYGLYARNRVADGVTADESEPLLRIQDFAQLARIAWNRHTCKTMGARDALALYESQWRFVEPADMTRQEKALLDYLTHRFGEGVLHV